MAILFGGEEPFVQFNKTGHYRELIREIILNLDRWFTRCCFCFFNISYLQFSLAEWNHLYDFRRDYNEKHFFEIIMILDQ